MSAVISQPSIAGIKQVESCNAPDSLYTATIQVWVTIERPANEPMFYVEMESSTVCLEMPNSGPVRPRLETWVSINCPGWTVADWGIPEGDEF